MFLDHTVTIFRELGRVLRDDGTLWINIGDSYNAGTKAKRNPPKNVDVGGWLASGTQGDARVSEPSLKPKDLMMIPARLAIALVDDGWYLRSDIIWSKPNPMPESVTDRPTSAHEHIFLLTKSAKYSYDADAVKTLPKPDPRGAGLHNGYSPPGQQPHRGAMSPGIKHGDGKQRGHGRRHDGFNDRWDAMTKDEQQANGANLRNVWEIATQKFTGSHFATFPPEIPRRCIKAGCPEGGTVLDPFSGSGTTGVVCVELDRNYIGIELNPEYAEMSRKRINQVAPLFVQAVVVPTSCDTADTGRSDSTDHSPLPLFQSLETA